jgi:hypothetical protein
MGYSWLTVHRVRFPEPRNARTDGAPPGPASAAAWRFGLYSPRGKDGFRTGIAKAWGGLGFYRTRDEAEEVFTEPGAHLPFLSEVDEHWHALAAVIAHRGEVDFSRGDEPHPEFVPLAEDPGGVMAVVTSAGYDDRAAADPDRIRGFIKGVDEVIEGYGAMEANVVATLFSPVGCPDGMTFSVWRGDREMLAAAYRNGVHPKNLKQHQEQSMFDRSSFTRLRLLNSKGTWDGIDPRLKALD